MKIDINRDGTVESFEIPNEKSTLLKALYHLKNSVDNSLTFSSSFRCLWYLCRSCQWKRGFSLFLPSTRGRFGWAVKVPWSTTRPQSQQTKGTRDPKTSNSMATPKPRGDHHPGRGRKNSETDRLHTLWLLLLCLSCVRGQPRFHGSFCPYASVSLYLWP